MKVLQNCLFVSFGKSLYMLEKVFICVCLYLFVEFDSLSNIITYLV